MLSNKLIKISLLLSNPLLKILKYKKLIKLYGNNIFIILGTKLLLDINEINILKKQLIRYSNYIETKAKFELFKIIKTGSKYYVIGFYNCFNISDDLMRKIIREWQTLGFKLNDYKNSKSPIIVQNTIY